MDDPFAEDLPIDPELYGNNYYLDESDSESGSDYEDLPPTPLHHEGVDPQTEARKKRAIELTRDQRLMIRTLYQTAGWTQATIFERRNALLIPLPTLTMRQIQTACDPNTPLTPKRSNCRGKAKVTDEQKALIKAFLDDKEHPERRLLPWWELPYWIDGLEGIRDSAIKRALKEMKYLRTQRPRKIKYTKKHLEDRVKWCKERKDWTIEQWAFYVFSDETWVNGTSPYRQWLTIHVTKNPDDFATIRERPNGWMFWASFYGGTKGPYLFWEKDSTKILKDEAGNPILDADRKEQKEWGYMNSTKYCEKILSKVVKFMDELDDITANEFKFQQDNASIHASKETVAWMKRHENDLWDRTIWWPAKSPDLNPIENVWRWMKEYVSRKDPMGRLSGQKLREAVEEA